MSEPRPQVAGWVRPEGYESVRAWLGIRFARAERFDAPLPVEFDESGSFDAFGASPAQEPPEMPELGSAPAEDSHFLNVWAPDGAVDLPVYVTLYGGGFEHGSGASWPFRGSEVAATGRAVVVSLNYRVGVLGFLSLSHLGGPFAHATNLGLQDVIVALGWVQQHIRRFGGDPARVAVIGESAGGFLAAALAAAPAAAGTFSRLGIFSAGASRIVPADRARSMADDFLAAMGLQDDPTALVTAPVDHLLARQSEILATDIGVRNGPSPRALGVVDDSGSERGVLSAHPAAAFSDGRMAHVPLLVSSTQDEIAFFRLMSGSEFAPAEFGDLVGELESWGVPAARATEMSRAYVTHAGGSLAVGRERALTDYIYRLPAARLAVAHATAGGASHLLMIGAVEGGVAGHAYDAAALLGWHMPDVSPATAANEERIARITLDFACGDDLPWSPVAADVLQAGSVGELRQPADVQYRNLLQLWDGVPRP
ncbi:carboxylesterase family protein [Microbacterium binotii]|uniref:carboxylesterase family protein n=1 Tax=Microbacterium binotii TaxID=462710 RepID=UPI001F35A9A5|nr:carboxylesterase family protein [Microbacterium binotii]UIN30200.1 carboxylesterase family protein [Microbacterium binotii]